MKTLKSFVVLTVLFFLPFANTNAQIQKEVFPETLTGCWELDCVGEELCGEIDFVMTNWSDNFLLCKRQLKYRGTLIGQTSGDLYTVKEVENTHGFFIRKDGIGFNHNYEWTAVIQKEGGPAIVIHSMYHYTNNANGEMVIEFETFSTSCD